MDKMKQWVVLTVVGVMAVLAAGWFLVVSPKRSEAADVKTNVASQERANSQLNLQLAQLKQQAKDLPRQQAKLAATAAKIPDNPALPALIRSLTKAADDAGVELVSIAPSSPVSAVPAASAGATLTQPTAATPTAGEPTTATLGTGAAAASVVGQLQQIPVSINVIGGYFQVEQFLDRVEKLARAMKLVGFSLTPGTSPTKKSDTAAAGNVSDGKVLSGQLNALVFMATGRTTVPTAPVAAK